MGDDDNNSGFLSWLENFTKAGPMAKAGLLGKAIGVGGDQGSTTPSSQDTGQSAVTTPQLITPQNPAPSQPGSNLPPFQQDTLGRVLNIAYPTDKDGNPLYQQQPYGPPVNNQGIPSVAPSANLGFTQPPAIPGVQPAQNTQQILYKYGRVPGNKLASQALGVY